MNQEQELEMNMQKDVTSFVQWLDEFIQKILQRKDASKQYAFAHAIDQYLSNGGTTTGYAVDPNYIDAVKAELQHDGTPFLEGMFGGKRCLIIRDCDEQKYEQALQGAKVVSGNYYQEMDMVEMAETFKNFSRIEEKDKVFIKFNNLDENFAFTLRNKCNDITKGFMVGTQVTGKGKRDFMVHARKVIDLSAPKDPNAKIYSRDMCRAYLAATLAYYGPNHNKNIQQLQTDERLNETLVNYDPGSNGKEMWVTGQGQDKDKAVRITAEGFTTYRIDPETHKAYAVDHVSRLDKNYKKELVIQLDGIFDECCFTNQEEFEKHALGLLDAKSIRPQKTAAENKISNAETVVSNSVDKLVKQYMAQDELNDESNLVHRNEKEIFDEYRQKCYEVFHGIEVNNRPVWMSQQEFEEIKTTVESVGFDVADYTAGIEQAMHDEQTEKKTASQIISEEKAKTKTREKSRTKSRGAQQGGSAPDKKTGKEREV